MFLTRTSAPLSPGSAVQPEISHHSDAEAQSATPSRTLAEGSGAAVPFPSEGPSQGSAAERLPGGCGRKLPQASGPPRRGSPIDDRIVRLREVIRRIEQGTGLQLRAPAAVDEGPFAAREVAAALPLLMTVGRGLHEIKPATPVQGATALLFALRLLTCARQADGPEDRRPIVLCAPMRLWQEFGRPYAPGLAALGLDPDRIVLVAPTRVHDVLWALEEVLRSGVAAALVGMCDQVDLTQSRRLWLAAEETGSGAVLLTGAQTEGAGAALTRWRVAAADSAPHPLLETCPGTPRIAVRLERARFAAVSPVEATHVLEWCHDTLAFRLAAALGDRASRAPRRAIASGGASRQRYG